MKDRTNPYLSVLIITIIAAGAAMFILHVASRDSIAAMDGSGADYGYGQLQHSILSQ